MPTVPGGWTVWGSACLLHRGRSPARSPARPSLGAEPPRWAPRVAVCLTFMFRSPYETFLEVVEFLMNAFPRMLLNDGSGGSLFLFWHHAHQARCCREQVWSPGGIRPPVRQRLAPV